MSCKALGHEGSSSAPGAVHLGVKHPARVRVTIDSKQQFSANTEASYPLS